MWPELVKKAFKKCLLGPHVFDTNQVAHSASSCITASVSTSSALLSISLLLQDMLPPTTLTSCPGHNSYVSCQRGTQAAQCCWLTSHRGGSEPISTRRRRTPEAFSIAGADSKFKDGDRETRLGGNDGKGA